MTLGWPAMYGSKRKTKLHRVQTGQILPVVRWQGELLQITYSGFTYAKIPKCGRGKVKGFSRAARLRMLKTVAAIDWRKVNGGLFITLTYPDSVADRTASTRNVDRHRFLRYMEKHLQRKVGALWRLELLPRKSGERKDQISPHFHFMVFGATFIPHEIVRGWWRSVLHVEGHLCTDVRKMNDGKHAGKYIAKYAAKAQSPSLDDATYLNTLAGRFWGIHRRELVPFHYVKMIGHVDENDVAEAEEQIAKVFRDFPRGEKIGFTLFGRGAATIGKKMYEKSVDSERGEQ
jgi:hypothetical protein